MNLKKSILIIIGVLLVDQISKIYVKTHFLLGDGIDVFSWFKIHFIENPGAAWGTKISDILPMSDKVGKLILTVFRLFAICGIGYWLYDTVKTKKPNILIVCVALIFAGAFGNIIDSVFYGVIFDGSEDQVATMFAAEPYGTWFHGRVVDMLYFPLVDTQLPQWIPFWGGEHFSFFDPVFNVADSAISVGVVMLLVFSKKAFPKESK